MYYQTYSSPVGTIYIYSNDNGICNVSFEEVYSGAIRDENEDITSTIKWMNEYFKGQIPSFSPKLDIKVTPFQREVYDILLSIPYGKTVSYGMIAKMLCKSLGKEKMSAQAVGTAVGKNPIAIIIPCHRVVAKGGIGGYHYPLEIKRTLLKIEKADCFR